MAFYNAYKSSSTLLDGEKARTKESFAMYLAKEPLSSLPITISILSGTNFYLIYQSRVIMGGVHTFPPLDKASATIFFAEVMYVKRAWILYYVSICVTSRTMSPTSVGPECFCKIDIAA